MRSFSVGKNLTANVKTTLFVVPQRQIAKWSLLWAINNASSPKHFSAYWYDKSENTEIQVIFEYPLAAKTYLRFDGGAYIALEEGDEIRVIAETGATTTCLVTLELEPISTIQFGQ